MANIITGAPYGYVAPASVGPAIPLEATATKELRSADWTGREIAILQCQLLFSLLSEMRLSNQQMFPGVNWESEREYQIDALKEQVDSLSIE